MSSSHNHGTKSSNNRVAGTIDRDVTWAVDAAIADHVAKMHTPIVTPPQPVPVPPPSGIPPTPADHDLLLRDFSDATLGEFRKVTYLDAKPGDGMRYATDYTHPISWPNDGGRVFLRERCIAQINGTRWDGTFLSTGGGMGAPTFALFRGYLEAAFRLPNWGVGTWGTPIWFRDDNSVNGGNWSARELDLYEFMENQQGRFTLHGYGAEQKLVSLAPGDIGTAWHRIGCAFTDTHTTLTFDGKEIARTSTVIDKPLNLLTDAKAGYPWQPGTPNAQTPREFDVDLAWIVASSKIPAGL